MNRLTSSLFLLLVSVSATTGALAFVTSCLNASFDAPSAPSALRAAPPLMRGTAPSILRFKKNLPLRTSTQLFEARYDNLVAGIAEVSMGLSIGTIFSESSVVSTGCGPVELLDSLERLCYVGVLAFSGCSLFTRIVQGTSLTKFVCQDYFGDTLLKSTVVQVRIAEWLSNTAILAAFLVVFLRIIQGDRMDGLSGIDVEMCRAIRE